MSARESVLALLDQIPDETLPAVARYLEAVLAGCPPDDPYEDEALSAEEEAMLAVATEEIARGDVVSHEEVGARLANHKERA